MNSLPRIVLISVLPLSCLLAGCATGRLEPRSLTESEQYWSSGLTRWYPAWRPPYVSPSRLSAAKATPETPPDVETVPAQPKEMLPEAGADGVLPSAPGAVELVLRVPVPTAPETAPAKAPAPTSSPAKPKTYTVKPGDTLGKIAARELGKASAWERLLQANHKILKSPAALRPGMVLRIPGSP